MLVNIKLDNWCKVIHNRYMKIEININEDEIERLMEDTGKKRADVQDALEEYFQAIVEDNSDEREDFVLTVLDDIVEDED